MNYLNPTELSFAPTNALFDIKDSEAGVAAYNHPRERVESVTERVYDFDRAMGAGALELFALTDQTDGPNGLAA